MTRVTKFRVGTSNNLNDGIDSPLNTSGTWTSNMGDQRNSIMYSYMMMMEIIQKLKFLVLVEELLDNPAWVELTWLYNNTAM